MARNDTTAAIIDGVLRAVVLGGGLSVALVAPRMIEVLDKPTAALWKKLDKRAQEREIRRVLYQMKTRGLVESRDYDHGIKITKAGMKRLNSVNLNRLTIAKPRRWDRRWRLVFYDIPIEHKAGRDALNHKLKELNFYHLQQSVFVHPFPCKKEISAVVYFYGIEKYVSYAEVISIDNEGDLRRKFRYILGHKI